MGSESDSSGEFHYFFIIYCKNRFSSQLRNVAAYSSFPLPVPLPLKTLATDNILNFRFKVPAAENLTMYATRFNIP